MFPAFLGRGVVRPPARRLAQVSILRPACVPSTVLVVQARDVLVYERSEAPRRRIHFSHLCTRSRARARHSCTFAARVAPLDTREFASRARLSFRFRRTSYMCSVAIHAVSNLRSVPVLFVRLRVCVALAPQPVREVPARARSIQPLHGCTVSPNRYEKGLEVLLCAPQLIRSTSSARDSNCWSFCGRCLCGNRRRRQIVVSGPRFVSPCLGQVVEVRG